MPVNQAALDLIKEFEGFIGYWYPDPATKAEPFTCCYGHTDAAGPPYYADNKQRAFTKEEGEEILARDLRKYEQHVKGLVQVPVNENQFGALVSFCFNLGPGNLAKSTLLRKLNQMDYAGAAGEFHRWNRAAGKEMLGLTRRRTAEAKLFSTPALATSAPVTPPPPDIEKPDIPVEAAHQPSAGSSMAGWLKWSLIGIALLIIGAVGWSFIMSAITTAA